MTRLEEMNHMWAMGMTYEGIGKEFNISRQRAHQILMKYRSFATNNYSAKRFPAMYKDMYCRVKACTKVWEHVHHIDKNSHNNDKSNLLPLCSPHHYELHTLY